MDKDVLPKAWENLMNSCGYIPVIVKSLEYIRDINFSMEPNVHDFYEMVYIKKGNAEFLINNKPIELGPNDITIIKPGQFHKLTVKSKNACEYIVLNFKFLNSKTSEHSEISLADFLNFMSDKESGAFIKLKVSQKNDIITILNRIVREKQDTDIGSDFLNYLQVMELFVYISRALKMEWENSINSGPKLKELIKIAINFINMNYERDISLGDISKYVFLSPSYFTRAFREETDMSPINYLLKTRIDRSKELLEDQGLKVSDIALSVGFSNQQRFNEMFKKFTGTTPMKFRKSVLEVHATDEY
jgi:AraC-like DNA-binding protein